MLHIEYQLKAKRFPKDRSQNTDIRMQNFIGFWLLNSHSIKISRLELRPFTQVLKKSRQLVEQQGDCSEFILYVFVSKAIVSSKLLTMHQ